MEEEGCWFIGRLENYLRSFFPLFFPPARITRRLDVFFVGWFILYVDCSNDDSWECFCFFFLGAAPSAIDRLNYVFCESFYRERITTVNSMRKSMGLLRGFQSKYFEPKYPQFTP